MTLSPRRTPVLGWNSWNAFRCYGISEKVILANADALIDLGLRDVGYDTVVVDDGWQAATRASDGSLRSCPKRFPSGMKWLGDQLHQRGLKFGLYLAPGRRTCAQVWDGYGRRTDGDAVARPPRLVERLARTGRLRPPKSDRARRRDLGSWGREEQDLAQLVDWGIDYLKYDWCRAEVGTNQACHEDAFALMSQLIDSADRDIVYSISEYGDQAPWEWAPQIAHSWRTTDDIAASAASVFSIARATATHGSATQPGAVGDPDMLQAGNFNNTRLDRTHVMLWAMLAAPMMIGTDLRRLKSDSPLLHALKDPKALEINQDEAVSCARLARHSRSFDVYERGLSTGSVTMWVNTGRRPATVTVPTDARETWSAGRRRSAATLQLQPADYALFLF